MQVVRAGWGKIHFLVDGVVRLGTYIFKAVALGAKAILVNSTMNFWHFPTLKYVLLFSWAKFFPYCHMTGEYYISEVRGPIMAKKWFFGRPLLLHMSALLLLYVLILRLLIFVVSLHWCRLGGQSCMDWQQRENMGFHESLKCWRTSLVSRGK